MVYEASQCTVRRFGGRAPRDADGAVVLLVPPLAGSPLCFDLGPGQSLAGHLLEQGHRPFVVEYGAIGRRERHLGLEHWVDGVLPCATEVVDAHTRGAGVHLLGWSLGGIFCLLTTAAHADLPIRSVTVIGSPLDVARHPVPVPAVARSAMGRAGLPAARLLGGAPPAVVRLSFRLASLDKTLTKPLQVLRHLHDRDVLASIEAVDRFIGDLEAYPGRSVSQLLQTFLSDNDLADGRLRLGGRTIDLADVRVPVLAVAGDADGLAPPPCVHRVAALCPNAPEVRQVTGRGGHLGVLAGRRARDGTWRALDAFLATHAGT